MRPDGRPAGPFVGRFYTTDGPYGAPLRDATCVKGSFDEQGQLAEMSDEPLEPPGSSSSSPSTTPAPVAASIDPPPLSCPAGTGRAVVDRYDLSEGIARDLPCPVIEVCRNVEDEGVRGAFLAWELTGRLCAAGRFSASGDRVVEMTPNLLHRAAPRDGDRDRAPAAAVPAVAVGVPIASGLSVREDTTRFALGVRPELAFFIGRDGPIAVGAYGEVLTKTSFASASFGGGASVLFARGHVALSCGPQVTTGQGGLDLRCGAFAGLAGFEVLSGAKSLLSTAGLRVDVDNDLAGDREAMVTIGAQLDLVLLVALVATVPYLGGGWLR